MTGQEVKDFLCASAILYDTFKHLFSMAAGFDPEGKHHVGKKRRGVASVMSAAPTIVDGTSTANGGSSASGAATVKLAPPLKQEGTRPGKWRRVA